MTVVRRWGAPTLASLPFVSFLACGSGAASPSASLDSGAPDSSGPASSTIDTGAPGDAPSEVTVDAATAGDAAADGSSGLDNGAPSTNYPAPHPPLPTLTNGDQGPVLTSPQVHLVFFPTYPYAADLQMLAQKLGPSAFWPATTHEYGVGTIGYANTIVLPPSQPAPTNISSTDIQTWVEGEIESGAFGPPDPQAIYTIVYPQGTTITQPNPVSALLAPVQSCVAFGGYHDNAVVAPADGGAPQNYAYAVLATCSNDVEDLTAVASHEWVEASTDPFVTSMGPFSLTGGPLSAYFTVDTDHTVWAVLNGGEAADLCEPEAPDVYVMPPDIGYEVQRTWSNVSAMASHDPCVPALAGQAFFDSAPVLNETVTFASALTATIVTKGITIPVGQSKTVEVDLFSDGDTGGPWTVQADDLLYKTYGSYGIPASLSFQWDRTSGVNGEKLHLTITVTSASVIGNGHAFMITSTLAGRVAVWPGMVVDSAP